MILVIGATGTVGGEVMRRLAAAGERVRALVRDPRKASQRPGEQVEYAVGDLDRPETLQAGLAGVERIFLLTRQSSRQVDQERGVIQAAAGAAVRHIVKLSVFHAEERSPLQVTRQHRQSERALQDSGLAYTILRPPFFMQNLLGMIRGGAIYTAAEDGRIAMIDARDVAAVAAAALTSPQHQGQIYTPTGPQALSFDEVARILSEQTGEQIRHVRVPPDAVRDAVQASGRPGWFADDMARLHTMLAVGYENVLTEDVHTATGHPPRTLAQFARDFSSALTGQQNKR
jgi:uncharacterized protein YbjT (DUF2867 family)